MNVDERPEPDVQAAADQTAQDARCLAQYLWAFWDEILRCNDGADEDGQMPDYMRIMLTYQFHHSMTTPDVEFEEE